MGGKKMEGNEEQKRQAARQAREAGRGAGEVGATTGGSQQRTEAPADLSHQQRVDLISEGEVSREDTPAARPGSRDAHTLDQERFPRR